MKRKAKYSNTIRKMVRSRQQKGLNAEAIADQINNSKTAYNEGVTLNTRSTAALMAWNTMTEY